MSSNTQLKLNSNAVVDNLYLVNLVHNPDPILIENRSSLNRNLNSDVYRGRLSSTASFKRGSNSNFEFIDEEKLSIYSYLIQRDLKTKEYLNKFELEQFEKAANPITASSAQSIKSSDSKKSNKENKSLSSTKSLTSSSSLSQKTSTTVQPESTPRVQPPIRNPTHSNQKLSNDVIELKKCCDDSVKAIENLEQQLNQFKFERLKVVYNDPQEEEKQKRILQEQIKYLLRSSYNLQNQINRIRVQFEHNKLDEKTSKMTPAARLTHTMRQVVKTINIFSDLYPYRPDRDTVTEKLCNRFYKQLQMSVENFSSCLTLFSKLASTHEFNSDTSSPIVHILNTKLDNCNRYFEDAHLLNDVDAVAKPQIQAKSIKKEKTKPTLNVVRAPRKAPVIKKQAKPIKKTNSNEYIQRLASSPANIRIEIPISNKKIEKPIYEKKTIKTARLFPSNRPSSNDKKILNESLNASSENLLKIKQSHFKTSSHTNLTEASKSATSFYSPALVHLSSPKLSKIGFEKSRKSPHRFRSSSANSNNSLIRHRSASRSPGQHTLDESIQQNNNDFVDDELSQKVSELKMKHASEMDQLKADFHTGKQMRTILLNKESSLEKINYPKLKRPDDLFGRMDSMQKENDEIRRKYEKLNYEENLMRKYSDGNQSRRRPYQECYLSDEALLTKKYEPIVDMNTLYRQVNKPRVDQLSRVLDYSKKFADYNQKTSVTVIGQSKFNDFELFETLAEDFFDDLINDVVEELEDVNQEITSHLINNELLLNNQKDYE